MYLNKDKLQETEALIFENLKPVEITKKLFQHHLNIEGEVLAAILTDLWLLIFQN